MNIQISACDISFELDNEVEVRGEDGLTSAKTVWFTQPNRKTAPIFQNLVAKFSRAVDLHFADIMKQVNQEDLQNQIEEQKQEQEQPKTMEQAVEQITSESVTQQVNAYLEMFNYLDFDFEEGFKLFERIILSGGTRSNVCKIGDAKLTEAILDRIDYQDFYKMFAVYLAFFVKPVKSGTKKELETQSDSAVQVTEL